MPVAQEGIFGPVASVITFSDEFKTLETANDTDYGFAAAIWTSDMNKAKRMTERLRAGIVWVNEYRVVAPTSPFGGSKDSGPGRESDREGPDRTTRPTASGSTTRATLAPPLRATSTEGARNDSGSRGYLSSHVNPASSSAEYGGRSPRRPARMLSAVITAISLRVSVDALPMWGVIVSFSGA